MMKRTTTVLAAAFLLQACGLQHSYSSAPLALEGVSTTGTVAVAVHDARPYVVSGNKPASFVGLARGGWGNPWDVKTSSGTDLAIEMRDAVVGALKKKGAGASGVVVAPKDGAAKARQALAATGARRLVLIRLDEWKSDTYMNTSIVYDVNMAVLDAKGDVLATSSARGNDNVGYQANPTEGIAGAFMKKIEQLFADPKIVAALR